MRHRGALFAAAFLALSLTAPSRPASALPGRDRLTVDVSPVTWGAYDAFGSDGYFSAKGAPGFSAYGQYGRTIARWLELGGGLSYGTVYWESLHIFRAYAFARAFGSFNEDALELGAALRLGPGSSALILSDETVLYLGGAAGFAVDIQVWVSEQVALRAGLEASVGLLGETGGAASPYFRGSTLWAGSLSPTLGLLYGFE